MGLTRGATGRCKTKSIWIDQDEARRANNSVLLNDWSAFPEQGAQASPLASGQHHQSRAENTFYRYKKRFGGRLTETNPHSETKSSPDTTSSTP